MSYVIEKGVRPLVRALNELDFVRTVYSCEGHFEQAPREKFLCTAYVTFGVSDPGKFKRLYERILAADESDQSVSSRMTYDCILGRYTLSIWADDSLQEPSRKRAVVDSAIRELSKAVVSFSEQPPEFADSKAAADGCDVLPCGETVPPCMLVIPPKELVCPFTKSSGE